VALAQVVGDRRSLGPGHQLYHLASERGLRKTASPESPSWISVVVMAARFAQVMPVTDDLSCLPCGEPPRQVERDVGESCDFLVLFAEW